MKSIKTKLIISFSALILIASLIIGLISIGVGYRAFQKDAQNSLLSLTGESAKLTQSRMAELITMMDMIAKDSDIINMGWEADVNILKRELGKTSFIDIGYILPNGYTYFTDGTVRLQSDRDYVQKALKGEANISDIVISRVSRKPELNVAVPIKKGDEVIGALVGRKEADALTAIIKDTGYGENGYAYMINAEGTMIAHPETELVVKRYNPIDAKDKSKDQQELAVAFQRIIKEKTGIVNYNYQGQELYAGFTPVKGTSWSFVTIAVKSEIFAAIPKMVQTIITVMILVLLGSIGLVFLLDASITRPLIKIARESEKISELNISMNIPEKFLNQKDEIGILSRAFQKLIVSLREITREITDSAILVAATSQELTATSQQSATIADEISKTVEEIAQGASDQAHSTQAGSKHAAHLGRLIEINNEHMVELNKDSQVVRTAVEEGLKEVGHLSAIAKENEAATREICDIILRTQSSSNQIGEASRVIASMAEQINLLSLNAAIEAARAGEAGKGFAVVAHEIKRMADQSGESTKFIDKIIKELQINIIKAVESMDRITVTSDDQKKSVAATIDKYQSIAKETEKSEKAIQILNQSEKDMDDAKEEIILMLESLSAIAQQNAAGSQQATSSMEEQTASVQEIAGASEKLSELSNQLQDIVLRFQHN